MITIRILTTCLLIYFILCQNDPKQLPTQGDVIILNNDNFEDVVLKSQDAWMIDFYAPWCGHCIKMADEWSKFATNKRSQIRVAKIDASQFSKFNDAYGLKGFPHIVFIPAGKKDKSTYFTHTGARTAQAFDRWVEQKADEHKKSFVERLTGQQKWTQICLGSHSDICTIFFLPSVENSSEEQQDFYLKTINGLTKKFIRQPISWLWTQDGDQKGLQQLFGLQQSFPYIVLVNPIGRRFAVMQSSFTEDNFNEWLQNAWDIQFKQFQGQLVFGDQIPQPPLNTINNQQL